MKYNIGFVLVTLFFPLFIGCEKEATSNNEIKNRSILPKKPTLPIETITLANRPFSVELAFSNQSRQKGLMFREKLDANKGMLFVFRKEEDLSFHMNNCLIDIDIAFIKGSGEITTIHEMKKPLRGENTLRYNTKAKSKYALEVAAGTFARLKIKEGDVISIPKSVKRISPEASLK